MWRSAVDPHSRSVRPNYPAAPAAARWLSMCLFISLQGSLHWLLGHPRHHITSRRADRRHDGGRRKETGPERYGTGILPATHTHTETWPEAVCKAWCKLWWKERCVCHISACPNMSLLPKKGFSPTAVAAASLSALPWRHWQGVHDRQFKWCLWVSRVTSRYVITPFVALLSPFVSPPLQRFSLSLYLFSVEWRERWGQQRTTHTNKHTHLTHTRAVNSSTNFQTSR